MRKNNFAWTIIMVQDPKIGGFTAYFKQLPNIIAEGETENEAEHNLLNAAHDVFRYLSEKDSEKIDPAYKVIERQVNVCIS